MNPEKEINSEVTGNENFKKSNFLPMMIIVSATRCFYHQDKIAISACERCHRPICLEDKRVYHRRVSYGDNWNTSTYEYCPVCYASQREFDNTASIIGGVVFIVIILIFGMLALGSMASFNSNNSINTNNNNNFGNNMIPDYITMSGVTYYCNNQGICDPSTSTTTSVSTQSSSLGWVILFVFFIIAFTTIGVVWYIRTQRNEDIDQAIRLTRSSNTEEGTVSKSTVPQVIKPIYQKKKELAKLICFECGTELDFDDKFCPNCGDSTKEEHSEFLSDSNQ